MDEVPVQEDGSTLPHRLASTNIGFYCVVHTIVVVEIVAGARIKNAHL